MLFFPLTGAPQTDTLLTEKLAAGEALCSADLPISRELWRKLKLPEPQSWCEFENLCRLGSFPPDFDACARILNMPLDLTAVKLIGQLRQALRGYFPPVSKPAFTILQRDGQRRVQIMRAIAGRVAHLYTEQEHATFQVHHRINQFGVGLDAELANKVLELTATAAQQRDDLVRRETNGKNTAADLGRINVLQDLLKDHGIDLPDMKAETVERLLERDDLPDQARTLLEARLGHSKIAHKRLSVALARKDADGRIRDAFKKNAAHTHRYGSIGVQLHNLPKPNSGIKINYAQLIQAAENVDLNAARAAVGNGELHDAITALIRLVFCPGNGKTYVIIDWSGIEPRIWAWLSGSEELLQMYRDGACVYCAMASRLFGRTITAADPERAVGKLTVIAGGYQMGGKRFGQYAEQYGLDLTKVKLTPDEAIKGFRAEHWRLSDPARGLWAKLHHGAMEALTHPQQIAGCLFEYVNDPQFGAGLRVTLPSGSRLFYPGACIEQRVPGYAKDTGQTQPTFVYYPVHSQGGFGSIMYGGRWLENIVQSIGKDLLDHVLAATDALGLPASFHCHDEIGWEVPEDSAAEFLKALTQEMETLPSWAKGLPLKAKGFIAPRWFKDDPRK
jgi:DNA polymerase